MSLFSNGSNRAVNAISSFLSSPIGRRPYAFSATAGAAIGGYMGYKRSPENRTAGMLSGALAGGVMGAAAYSFPKMLQQTWKGGNTYLPSMWGGGQTISGRGQAIIGMGISLGMAAFAGVPAWR